jgi:Domain of unknown function (DUF4406)
MKLIFIAGPYTSGNLDTNVQKAINAAEQLAQNDFVPYVPHLSRYWHDEYNHPKEFWMKVHQEYIFRCDAMLMLPGNSVGTIEEKKYAEKLNKPVFHSITSLS